ncbi:PAS sensor protein [Methylorubrum extorquens]|uniref:Blue-light-activated histidine kinase n=1 Tax=Methylorubrum extorquens TaxID=408 RepID=A0A1S1P6U1_METEX|nr:PAS sensor protein [Methylorubrum extorquens]
MTGFPKGASLPSGVTVEVFAAAFEASPTPMVVTDPRRGDNPVVWANCAFLGLTGYAREELYGQNCRMLQGPLTDAAVLQTMRSALATGRPFEGELLNYRKDGTSFWNGMTINPVCDEAGKVLFFFSAQADMTDKHRLELAMRDANDALEREVSERTADLRSALEQKTALLHEVDHRVKNNLQVISSLMLLKARRTPEGDARNALQAMADRIGALSTAHRMLYSEGDVTRFDFREFTADLIADLAAGLDGDRTRIETEIEALALSAAMAAPLALLIHELTTNALHHAFPEARRGRVAIEAHRFEAGMRLVIQDDGIGMAAVPSNPAGFGRTLVEMVVRQLRGTLEWSDAGPGTRITITIPLVGTDAL